MTLPREGMSSITRTALFPRRSRDDMMGQAASQWSAFAWEVAKSLEVVAMRDESGFRAPITSEGTRAMPFWSSLSRAVKLTETVPAYRGFEPVVISWESFRDNWLPGLVKDGFLVGVNWSGPRATGYDVAPQEVAQRIEYEIEQLHT